MKKNEVIAILLAFSACIIWSGNFVIARGVSDWIAPMTLAFWRWFIAFIVIFPFGFSQIRKELPIIRNNWKYLLIMGVLGVGVYNTLIYYAGHYTSTYHIALISATAPIGTLLLAGIFGIERLSRYKVLGAISAFAGALTVVTEGHIGSIFNQTWNTGDIILIFSTLIWASWSVAITLKPKGLSTRSFLTVIIGIGTLFLTPFYIRDIYYIGPGPFTVEAFSIYLYIGVMASVIAWFFWQHSVETVGSVKTSLIYYSMPIFSGFLAILILDEKQEAYHIYGFILVFAGIIISNLRKMGLIKDT